MSNAVGLFSVRLFLPFPARNDEEGYDSKPEDCHSNSILLLKHLLPVFRKSCPITAEQDSRLPCRSHWADESQEED